MKPSLLNRECRRGFNKLSAGHIVGRAGINLLYLSVNFSYLTS